MHGWRDDYASKTEFDLVETWNSPRLKHETAQSWLLQTNVDDTV